ncbi:MAG: DNA-formamidopyrimidine glycosylase family protein, partial [Miltoncostaeaceae bacterium]
MPEGHTIHRAARKHADLLAGAAVGAESPQGRFMEGARAIDGCVLEGVDAHGKHLLYRFPDDLTLHVHLGLFGRFFTHRGAPPEPRGAIRLRLSGQDGAIDLRGPTACELVEPPEVEALLARLGPDPLRADADPERA